MDIEDFNNNYYQICILARINPAAFSRHRQEITIGDWKPIPETGGCRYYATLPFKTERIVYIKLIEDLNCLLAAYFLTDFQPRDLVDFKVNISDNNKDDYLNTVTIFGQSDFIDIPTTTDIGNEILDHQRVHGFSEFYSPTRDIQFSENYPWHELKEHYEYLKNKPDLVLSLSLIRESFMKFNKSLSLKGYVNEIELIEGIILLVSSIENLLFKKFNSQSELRFKFSLFASILYEKNVHESDFNNRLNLDSKKLLFTEAQEIFEALYDIRSDLAHGTLNSMTKVQDKNWQKLSRIFHVNIKNNQDSSIRKLNYSHIMSIMQQHISLFIKNSLEDFFSEQQEDLMKYLKIEKDTLKP